MPPLIDERVRFSWPIVAALVTAALFVGGVIYKVNALEEKQRELAAEQRSLSAQVAADRADAAAFRAVIGTKLERLAEDVSEIKKATVR